MRKLSILLALLLAPAAWAQFTTVSGTVVDPNGVPYAYGTITATLPTNGVTPLINGNQFSGSGSAGLDRNGSFTMNLASNALMVPGGLQWIFTVCSGAGTVAPAFGTGPQCFTPAPITISGSTQSITSQLHAVAPALTVPFGTPGGGVTSFNGRTGAVLPQAGDYTADMIGGAAGPVTWNNGNNAVTFNWTLPCCGPVFTLASPNMNFVLASAGPGNTSNSNLIFQHSQGTFASPTACATNDVVQDLVSSVYNGTAFVVAGTERTACAENWTPTTTGLYYSIATVPIGSPASATQIHELIDGNGNVDLGAPVPGSTAGPLPNQPQYTEINGYTGELTPPASTSSTAGFNCIPGVAPTSPVNGDVWCTNGGMFTRVAGGNVGPFGPGVNGGIYAANYGATGEGHLTLHAVISSAPTQIVTCSDCHFSTNATAGMVFWATNLCQLCYGPGTLLVTAAGTTIASVDSDTQIHLSANATANCASLGCTAIWGTDESTQLNNAWTQAQSDCVPLILPGVNPEGTGPAVLIVSSGQFQGACGGSPTGGVFAGGPAVFGQGITATFVAPSPAFNPATCTAGTNSNACFGGNVDGPNYCCFSFNSGGISQLTGFSAKVGFELDSFNTGKMWDMNFRFWGAGSPGVGTNSLGIGMLYEAGQLETRHVENASWGYVGTMVAGNTAIGSVTELFPLRGGNGGSGVCDQDAGSDYLTFGGTFENNGGYSASVINGATWTSLGDTFGAIGGVVGTGTIVTVGLCNEVSGNVSGAGTMRFNGSKIYTSINAPGAWGLYLNGSTNSAYLSGTVVESVTSGTGIENAGGAVFDAGGNSFIPNGGTNYAASGGGTEYGSASITGTTQVAANITASTGWGTSGAAGNGISAVTGNSQRFAFTITTAGTPSANPTFTATFPTPFLVAPQCSAQQTGGNDIIEPITNGTITATATGSFVWNGTPTTGKTYTITVSCQ